MANLWFSAFGRMHLPPFHISILEGFYLCLLRLMRGWILDYFNVTFHNRDEKLFSTSYCTLGQILAGIAISLWLELDFDRFNRLVSCQ
ncbi:hypothetical protein vseg_014146 [Gypsophila vaccaria]